MKLTPLRLVLAVLLALIAISFLGGTAVWRAIGIGDDLSIDGRAEPVREAPGDLGQGWPAYGGDEGGHRYSAADQINRDNVATLEPAWVHQTGTFEGREAARHRASFQATPILVDDALILCTQFNEVIALDPGVYIPSGAQSVMTVNKLRDDAVRLTLTQALLPGDEILVLLAQDLAGNSAPFLSIEPIQ